MLSLQLSSLSSTGSACSDWDSTGGAGLGALRRIKTGVCLQGDVGDIYGH